MKNRSLKKLFAFRGCVICVFLVIFWFCLTYAFSWTTYTIVTGRSVSSYIKFEIAKLLFVKCENAIFAVPKNHSSLHIERESCAVGGIFFLWL